MTVTRRHFLRSAAAGASTLLVRGRQAQAGILVRGGTLVEADGQRESDVRIRGETIVEIGRGLEPREGERVVEARGLQVLPGGIDPHTHLSPPWADDFESGSRAALAGGITTIGCMTRVAETESLLDAVSREAERVQKEAIADIILHPIVGEPKDGIESQIAELRRAGHTSIKFFMTSVKFTEMEDRFLAVLRAAGREGMLTCIHCEDQRLLAEAAARLEAEGKTSLRYFAESRPVACEAAAVEHAARMAEEASAPVYIVHLSSQAALEASRKARARGVPLHVETRPLYLYFTEEKLQGPDGPLYIGQPPLRSPSDVEAMWDGLREGGIDALGSDHAPWTREQKMAPDHDIQNLRPGVADLQTMLPVLYSEGVTRGRLSLERFVALTSTNAAKLFGLFPRKGTVSVGADGDLCLWDPGRKWTLGQFPLFSRAGFSLYEGWELTGRLVLAIRRGEIACEDGKILAEAGSGRLCPRSAA